MATAHSVRHSAAVKSISRQAELRGRKASHERQQELHRQREELAEFLAAFEFDDAVEPDNAEPLVALRVF